MQPARCTEAAECRVQPTLSGNTRSIPGGERFRSDSAGGIRLQDGTAVAMAGAGARAQTAQRQQSTESKRGGR